MGFPHWGAGNVYHERADGTPYFDFQLLDRVYDTVVEAGHVPIVELGFTPRARVPDRRPASASSRAAPPSTASTKPVGGRFPLRA